MNKAQQAFEKERRGVPPAPAVTKVETVVRNVRPEGVEPADLELVREAVSQLLTRVSSLENRVSTLEKEHADALSAAVERVEADHA